MTTIDFTPFFTKYEAIVALAEGVFDRVKKEYPDCVKCKTGCADCCHALFDLSLIEAIYINHHFNKNFKDKAKETMIEKANRADRAIFKIKKASYKSLEQGKSEPEILAGIAMERVKCPLLNNQEMCDLYDYRPITCRFYGIPTVIGGISHTCGITGFKEGNQYPAVNIDKIQKRLFEISAEFVSRIKTRYIKMGDMLIPVSMAMLTDFDSAYLGLVNKNPENQGR